jgi:outer membrane protein
MKNQNIQLLTTIASSVALLGVIVLLILQFSTQQKVAYVKTDVLLEKYQGMIEAKQKYQTKAVAWQANMDTLKVELKGIMDDYQANQSKWNAAKQQQVEKDIQAKQKQFNDYQQAISQQAQQEDQQLTQGVLNQVNAYIEAYGKKYHYKIIFGANGSGTIVYGTDAIDITDTILKGLNKEYNGGA